jgi:hypothetical protein
MFDLELGRREPPESSSQHQLRKRGLRPGAAN